MDTVIEVEIGAGTTEGTYVVHVLRSLAGGEPTATVTLDIADVLDDLPQIEASILASSVAARRVMSTRESAVQAIGVRLFDTIFTGRVAEAYRASSAVATERGLSPQLTLRLTSPELAALPWEALYDSQAGRYVSRKEPLVRRVSSPYGSRSSAIPAPLRILGMVSSPKGLQLLDVEAEKERLESALADHIADGRVELVWLENASWSGLHGKLLSEPWHVVHFIGHGGYDEESDEGLIALVGRDGRADFVSASSLADLLNEAGSVPRLVVLNSCQSGATGTSDLFAGTAATLVHSGINAVVAMQFAVSDYAALAFARSFYLALASGRRIDEAVRSGRIGILGITRDTLEWITPVVYIAGDDTRLIDPSAVRHQPAAATADAATPADEGEGAPSVVLPGLTAASAVTHAPSAEFPPARGENEVAADAAGFGPAAGDAEAQPAAFGPTSPPFEATPGPDAGQTGPATHESDAAESGPATHETDAAESEPATHETDAAESEPAAADPVPVITEPRPVTPGPVTPGPVTPGPVTAEPPARPGPVALEHAVDPVRTPAGTRIGTEDAASIHSAEIPAVPVPVAADPLAFLGSGTPTPPIPPKSPEAERPRRRVLLVSAIVVGVLVIAGAAWGAWTLWGGTGVSPTSESRGQETSSSTPAPPPPATPTVMAPVEVQVLAATQWTATGVQCEVGDTVTIDAAGTILHEPNPNSTVSPDGLADPWYHQFNVEGLPDSPTAGLIGSVEQQQPFVFVGSHLDYACPSNGEFYLGVNDRGLEGNSGWWTATVTRTDNPTQ
ncbi:CHAT domain-containing protein [Microbacterium sp. B2969]|uniref:CHAT domain-containing protein n=1 Tax=Microbacterium alkaliflavum TaxID=3248839 RepID=A0ABW7QBA5_9MICO